MSSSSSSSSSSVKATTTTSNSAPPSIQPLNIKLDNGVLAKIMNNHNIEKPKLQVLSIRNINPPQTQNDRYLIILSDGDFIESACLLLPNLNPYVRTLKLKKDSIIQLDKYALNSIPNGKVLVIVELTIICTEYPMKIGNPVPVSQKSQQQQQAAQANQQQKRTTTTTTTNSNNNTNKTSTIITTTTITSKKDDDIEEICKCSNCQDKNTILLCYKMLGLNESATKDEVRSRYIYLANENNEKIHHDSKLAEKFDIMTKAYTLIMGLKSCETSSDDDDDGDEDRCPHHHNHSSSNNADDDNDSSKSKSSSSTKSKIKIPLEDFLQYAWLKAADECSYDTDSDSECDIGFHRRKNRNPKAFYQQMKKSNKTLSIKAMKKRAKEVQSLQNNEKISNLNANSTKNNNKKLQNNKLSTTTTKLNDNKKLEVNGKSQTSAAESMESSSVSEIKILLRKQSNSDQIVEVAQQQQQQQQEAKTKKKKNKKKKNKNKQQQEQSNEVIENANNTVKQALPPPPPPPPPPVAEVLINELKSDSNNNNTKKKKDLLALATSSCCNVHNHENETKITSDDDDDEDNDEESGEEEDDESETEEDAKLRKKSSDVAVSAIATNIENLTNAFIPKDDTPESKNLRDKLKNIVTSLQSLQQVIDTQDLKMHAKFSSSKPLDGNENLIGEENNAKNGDSSSSSAFGITENFIKNVEKLMSTSGVTGNGTTTTTTTTKTVNGTTYIKSATFDLSSKELKRSHDSILSELIETRNEINNARNRKLMKDQQLNGAAGNNSSQLSSTMLEQLSDLRRITVTSCTSGLKDFKISDKLIMSTDDFILDDVNKMKRDAHSELLSHIDNVQTLSSLATETLKKQQQQFDCEERDETKFKKKKKKQKKEETTTKTAKKETQKVVQQPPVNEQKNRKQQPKVEASPSPQLVIDVNLTESNNNNSKKKKNKNKANTTTPSQQQLAQVNEATKRSKDKKQNSAKATVSNDSIEPQKQPVIVSNNLSNLDSFNLDSLSSGLNSLVATTTSSSVNTRAIKESSENEAGSASSSEDAGDWIQVKKPARNASNDNTKTVTQAVSSQIKTSETKITSKGPSVELNLKKAPTTDNVWNRSSSLTTNNLMQQNSKKTIAEEKNKARSSESVAVDVPLTDLIPKSIDEEEIMFRKALELSLKDSEESKTKEPSIELKSAIQPKKLDCIDDFSTEIDTFTVKKDPKQANKQKAVKMLPVKAQPVAKKSSPNKPATVKPETIIVQNSDSKTPPPNVISLAQAIRLPEEQNRHQQKKGISSSSSYTNGISYAAKSAAKLHDEPSRTSVGTTATASTSSSISSTSSLASNFIPSKEEFPPVSVHSNTTTVKQAAPVNSVKAPTQLNNHRTSKLNQAKIPTQTVAPLQQHCRSVSPTKNQQQPSRPESIVFPAAFVPLSAMKSSFDAESPVSLLGLKPTDLNPMKPIGGVNMSKQPIFGDFKDNGVDKPIDSSSNGPNVDSPKKAVGAERPIGFKPNLPTAIVAPTIPQHSISPLPIITPIGKPVQTTQMVLSSAIKNNENIPLINESNNNIPLSHHHNTTNNIMKLSTPPPVLPFTEVNNMMSNITKTVDTAAQLPYKPFEPSLDILSHINSAATSMRTSEQSHFKSSFNTPQYVSIVGMSPTGNTHNNNIAPIGSLYRNKTSQPQKIAVNPLLIQQQQRSFTNGGGINEYYE